MDNKVFNVNGRNKDDLKLTLDLVSRTDGYGARTVDGWSINKEKGLILHKSVRDNAIGVNRFMSPILPSDTVDQIWVWLQSDEAKTIPFEGWDADCDHDGHNSLGWRVYVEDWGHVNHDWSALCAIKAAWLWHGK